MISWGRVVIEVSVLAKALNRIPRKIDVKTLIMISLIIVILIQILFMWFFIKKQTPVIGLTPVAVQQSFHPKYLYSIGFQANNPDASLDAPLDMAVDKFGRTFVVDTGHDAIKVYNSYGQYQFQFGRPGHQPGQLSNPVGIAIDGNYVYITEAGNQRVSVFDLKGRFVNDFIQEKAIPELQGMIPCGIAVSPQGVVLVTDIFKHRVIGFTKDGYIMFKFGGPGQEPGKFAYPNDVAVDEKYNIYVSDSNNARVQVFDKEGHFLYVMEEEDPKKKFSLPRGLAVVKDKLFVVDTLSHTVRIMDKKKQVAQFGEYGDENGQFNYPNGVTVAGDKIYVADRANDRVVVLTY